MRLIKTLMTCAAIGAFAAVPAAAQSMGPTKPAAAQSGKSKMSSPDSGEKHAMAKKDTMAMKDSAGMAKPAMMSKPAMKSDKPMTDDKSKGMMKPKMAKDTGMKQGAMAKDSATGMKKPDA